MLNIELDYYNSDHKSQLSKGAYRTLGTPKLVTTFKAKGKISRESFLNYFLIRRSDHSDFSDYKSRLAEIALAAAWLDRMLDTRTTINWCAGSKGLQEQVGEAVSLAVASSMFGLTAADWTIIPEQKGRKAHQTFDFERTMAGVTSGNAVIQVESKGSFVKDNTVPQKAVDRHATNIEKKKVSIASKGITYKHPATARYGMIASIDPKNTAKCWLLDPPAEPFEGNAHNLKVANRTAYVAEMLSLISPKASLPRVLMKRADEWREKQTSSPLPSLGRPFTVQNYVEQFLSNGKIWLADRDIVGQLFIDKEDQTFFIGLLGDVIRKAIHQDDKAIAQAKYRSSVQQAVIKGSPVFIGDMSKQELVEQPLNLHVTSSGLVIGLGNGQ